jgi:hypothetical protein
MIDLDALLVCPSREGGGLHEWAGTDPARGGDPRNSCRHCGRPGRDNEKLNESGGMFAEATAARAAFFAGLTQPKSVKAWGKS